MESSTLTAESSTAEAIPADTTPAAAPAANPCAETEVPDDRFTRQTDFVPRKRMLETSVTVIGVGAIGRQVAIQLAALGAPNIQLIDFDTVEISNVTTQGYLHAEIGQKKVDALAKYLQLVDPTVTVEVIDDQYRAKYGLNDVIFCCVDTISVREQIWKSLKSRGVAFFDARMLGEMMRILSVSDKASGEYYENTLFDQSEAQTGACTARATIYTANIAAGMMMHQFTRWLRGIPVDKDLVLNLASSELNEPLPEEVTS